MGYGRGKLLFGPVPSRRLGRSLGFDLLAPKTCTSNCVYCQLGRTSAARIRRGRFVDLARGLGELRALLEADLDADFITFSGSGEPTLSLDLGRAIRAVKRMTDIPVAVITNGTLLYRPGVRRDLAAADLVVPTLVAGTPGVFGRLCRPHPAISFRRHVEGLAAFCRGFPGRVRLGVMLVEGINDSPAQARAIKMIISRLRVEKVQIGTIDRPPAEPWARPCPPGRLRRAARIIGEIAPVEIVSSGVRRGPHGEAKGDLGAAILGVAARRPITVPDICGALGVSRRQAARAIEELLRGGKLLRRRQSGRTYFEPRRPGDPREGA